MKKEKKVIKKKILEEYNLFFKDNKKVVIGYEDKYKDIIISFTREEFIEFLKENEIPIIKEIYYYDDGTKKENNTVE